MTGPTDPTNPTNPTGPTPPVPPTNVVPITPGVVLEGAPDPDIVEMLEGLLVEAKSGELRGLAVAVANSNGAFKTAWQSDGKTATLDRLRSAVFVLSHRMVCALV